jgi:hypothetical protein
MYWYSRWIYNWCSLLDSLIAIFTFGLLITNFGLRYLSYRVKKDYRKANNEKKNI